MAKNTVSTTACTCTALKCALAAVVLPWAYSQTPIGKVLVFHASVTAALTPNG